jgi:hypothetical protein
MKLSDMKTTDERLAEDLRVDQQFRCVWERTGLLGM